METVIFLVLVFAVFLYVMIRGAIEERNNKRRYREELREAFGKFPDRVCSAEELGRISMFYLRRQGENDIDDITWNDLSMDKIFARMNFTQSSSGEEYLYAMLRAPVLHDNDGKLRRMGSRIRYMMEHEGQRLDTMMLLHELGNTGKYALCDYLDYLGGLGKRSNLPHFACILLLAAAVALIFVKASLGVPMVIAAACINIVSYMKEKSVAAPYVTSFAYILRMLHCADSILGLDYGGDMEDYKLGLQEKRSSLRGFEKNSGMVLRLNASTGSIEEILLDYVRMLTHIDLIQFNKMLNSVLKNREQIEQLADAIGYLDAVISIGYFRAALPYYCEPVLRGEKGGHFTMKEGIHPCIDKPVANSFDQSGGMIITGSNASGKSTFLKTAAVNAILAQTVYTCAAEQYSGSYFRIYSSMAHRDDLDSGESYYIVEIKALKRIMDAAGTESANPLLCFVDEVLRGTNTVERIAASAQILKKLSHSGIYCFAATHDIELTHLLEKDYDNYHFEEEVRDGDVLFSYRLRRGRAYTRNAIKLLEVIGFSGDIVRKADDMAGKFLETGEWERDG